MPKGIAQVSDPIHATTRKLGQSPWDCGSHTVTDCKTYYYYHTVTDCNTDIVTDCN